MEAGSRFRLIAVDVDGTLLDDRFQIGERTRAAIRRATAAGVRVVLATGRPFRSVQPYAISLGLNLPVICYNGAVVQDAISLRRRLFRPLPRPLAAGIARYLEEAGFYVKAYVDEVMLVGEATPETEWFSRHYGVPYHVVGRLSSYLLGPSLDGRETPMLVAYAGSEEEGEALARRLRERFGGGADCYRPNPWAVDIVAAGTSKGAALAALAASWGIGAEEAMALGNAGNDVEMLRWAGLGVAVANATPELRAVAGAVVADNNHDGVAEAIERFVLSP